MTKISVVIPTYNRQDTLKRTILSFQGQTFKDFEIIAADDGSTDGTKEMVEALKLPFPVKHAWQQNAGRSAARNLGVRHASGEIIVFIDDHNIVVNNFLEEHLRFHQTYKVGAVRGRMIFINQPEEATQDPVPLSFVTLLQKRLEENNPLRFHTGNVSVSKKAFEAIGGFDEDFKEYGFQDQEFGYRLRKAGFKIKYNPRAVGHIFKAVFAPAKIFDKARQAGHSAVLVYRKHPAFGRHCGVNIINRWLYWIFSLNGEWWLRWLERSPEKNRGLIWQYHFLKGMTERL